MATYNDLRQEIVNNGYEVTSEDKMTLRDDSFEHYVITGIRKSGTTGNRDRFYVFKDVETGECFWQDKDPFLTTGPTFRDKVEGYLIEKKNEGIIEAGFIDKINFNQRTALVSANWLDNNDNWVNGEFILDEDSNGNVQHRQIS